ncbi:MAG: MarR family transcriptional regulator [Tepidisphaeraceae bacterium]|jgi:DNA-binding MarR family transcriptional regulator
MHSKLAAEIRKIGPFESLEQEVFLNCWRTTDWLMRSAWAVLKGAELSPALYNVLRIIRGAGPQGISCQDIAQRMITRDPDLTRLLDRLEKRRLVTRHRQQRDRRVVKATITEAGLAVLAQLDDPIHQMHLRQLGHLGKQRLTQLLQLLEEVRGQPVAAIAPATDVAAAAGADAHRADAEEHS